MEINTKIHDPGIINIISGKDQKKPSGDKKTPPDKAAQTDSIEARTRDYDRQVHELQESISENQARKQSLQEIKVQFQELGTLSRDSDAGDMDTKIGEMIDKIKNYVNSAQFNGRKLIIPGKEFAALLSDGIISKDRVTNIVEELSAALDIAEEAITQDSNSMEKKVIALENSIAASSGLGDQEKNMEVARLTAEKIRLGEEGNVSNIVNVDSDRIRNFLQNL